MNNVSLVGNLTKDPVVRTTPSGVSVANFTIAVNRRYRSRESGAPETDFIPCVAWRERAEFVSKWLRKGTRVAVTGELRTRTYDDPNGSGQRRFAMEVEVANTEFADSKSAGQGGHGDTAQGARQQEPYGVPSGYGEPQLPAPPSQNVPPQNDSYGNFYNSEDFEPMDESELPF